LGSDVAGAGAAPVTAAAAASERNGAGTGAGTLTGTGTGVESQRRASGPRDSAAVRIEILDAAGGVVRTLEAPGTAGFHQVVWDLRIDPPYEPEASDQGSGGRFGFGGPPRGPRVLPGTYTARLTAGAATLSTAVEVRYDPRIDVPLAELEARQKSLLDLHRLAKPLYEAGQALRKADERIAAARKALREAGGAEATKAIL